MYSHAGQGCLADDAVVAPKAYREAVQSCRLATEPTDAAPRHRYPLSIGHALMHLRLSISTILIDFVRLCVYFDHRSGDEMIRGGQRLTK